SSDLRSLKSLHCGVQIVRKYIFRLLLGNSGNLHICFRFSLIGNIQHSFYIICRIIPVYVSIDASCCRRGKYSKYNKTDNQLFLSLCHGSSSSFCAGKQNRSAPDRDKISSVCRTFGRSTAFPAVICHSIARPQEEK